MHVYYFRAHKSARLVHGHEAPLTKYLRCLRTAVNEAQRIKAALQLRFYKPRGTSRRQPLSSITRQRSVSALRLRPVARARSAWRSTHTGTEDRSRVRVANCLFFRSVLLPPPDLVARRLRVTMISRRKALYTDDHASHRIV